MISFYRTIQDIDRKNFIAECQRSSEKSEGLRELFAAKKKISPEVLLPHYFVLCQLFRRTLEKHLPLKKEVRSICNGEGFIHIMIRNKDTNIALFEVRHNVLDILYGDGIDAGKGLIEHDKTRIDSQTACYLHTSTLAPG